MSAANLDQRLVQVVFAIDPGRASTTFLEDLWDHQYGAAGLAGQLALARVGAAADGASSRTVQAWWQRGDAYRVFLSSADGRLAAALAAFVVEHRLLLSRIWVGRGDQCPPDQQARDQSGLIALQAMAAHNGGVAV